MKASTALRHLFVDNPMLAEVSREKKKALAEHNWKGGQLAARILLALFYLFLLAMTLRWIEYVEPIAILYIMLGIAMIALPSSLHGAIAGEREQRALDMLLVAPVTPAQIIVGKYMKAFLMIALLLVFIGGPALIVELVRVDQYNSYRGSEGSVGGLIRATLLIITTSCMVSAITMLISTKTRTKTSAMLTTIGTLFLLFAVVPMIAGIVSFVFPSLSEVLLNTNPFALLGWAYMGRPEDYAIGYSYEPTYMFHPSTYVWPSMAVQILVTLLCLSLASNNLHQIARGRKE